MRRAEPADREALWRIFRRIAAEGESYPQHASITLDEFGVYWFGRGGEQWVASDDRGVVAGYTVRDNQPGRGRHVATASFIVDDAARGRGLGRAMGEHALERARALGYASMQFNLVVSTNTAAVELWKRLGFAIAGTLPDAFDHPKDGYVDAFVMTRVL